VRFTDAFFSAIGIVALRSPAGLTRPYAREQRFEFGEAPRFVEYGEKKPQNHIRGEPNFPVESWPAFLKLLRVVNANLVHPAKCGVNRSTGEAGHLHHRIAKYGRR
jgi:hypothetical protein